MIGSDILTEHHLTPRGWEAGKPAADRVETWTRRVFEDLRLWQGRSSLALRVGFTGRGARRARRSPQPALPRPTGDMVTRVTWVRSSRCNGGSPLTALPQSGTMPPLAGWRRLRSTLWTGTRR